MTSTRLHAQQHGLAAGLRTLQLGRELVAVPRDDTIVPIGCRDERGGITDSRFHVVHRRIGAQRSELLCVLREPVVGGPLPRIRAGCVITQHVENTDRWQCSGKQIRSLQQRGSDQQPPVAAPRDRKVRRRGDLLGNEIFRRCDEIIENVLLARFRARFVPGVAILTAATQISLDVSAAHFEPRDHGRAKRWRDRHVETTVSIQQRRRLAIARRTLTLRDVHRHPGTVLAAVEHLPSFIGRGVGSDLRFAEHRSLERFQIEAHHLPRAQIIGVGEKGFIVFRITRKAGERAHAWHVHLTLGFTIAIKKLGDAVCISHVANNQMTTDITRLVHREIRLRYELTPGSGRGVVDVDCNDATARRRIGRLNEECVALVTENRVTGIPGTKNRLRLGARDALVDRLDAVGAITIE